MTRNDLYNWPIQGTAFHCLLWSLIRIAKISRKEKWKSKIIGQIHDSILFDAHPSESKRILEVCQQVMCHDIREEDDWISVPLVIEAETTGVDQSWYYKQECNLTN